MQEQIIQSGISFISCIDTIKNIDNRKCVIVKKQSWVKSYLEEYINNKDFFHVSDAPKLQYADFMFRVSGHYFYIKK